MTEIHRETVIDVHHWSDTLFTIKATRNRGLRFRNGEFAMMGMEIEGRPLMRAYSMASANYEDHLEFYSIKVQQGALTSRLQHIIAGDEIIGKQKTHGDIIMGSFAAGKTPVFAEYRNRAGAISFDHKRPRGLPEF